MIKVIQVVTCDLCGATEQKEDFALPGTLPAFRPDGWDAQWAPSTKVQQQYHACTKCMEQYRKDAAEHNKKSGEALGPIYAEQSAKVAAWKEKNPSPEHPIHAMRQRRKSA